MRPQGRSKPERGEDWAPEVAKPKKDTSITVMKKHFEF